MSQRNNWLKWKKQRGKNNKKLKEKEKEKEKKVDKKEEKRVKNDWIMFIKIKNNYRFLIKYYNPTIINF